MGRSATSDRLTRTRLRLQSFRKPTSFQKIFRQENGRTEEIAQASGFQVGCCAGSAPYKVRSPGAQQDAEFDDAPQRGREARENQESASRRKQSSSRHFQSSAESRHSAAAQNAHHGAEAECSAASVMQAARAVRNASSSTRTNPKCRGTAKLGDNNITTVKKIARASASPNKTHDQCGSGSPRLRREASYGKEPLVSSHNGCSRNVRRGRALAASSPG
jgi:hypothetical protein